MMKICLVVILTCFLQIVFGFQGKSGIRWRMRKIDAINVDNLEQNTEKSNRTFFIETHGCQMNRADSEIVRSVLAESGFEGTDNIEDADLILTNTCAVRENAEAKVWQRLKYFQSLRKANKKRNREAKKNKENTNTDNKPDGYPIIGVLGCMAERLKTDLMEKAEVDFIAGPDAYRDLPNLLNIVDSSTDAKAANTALSLEETYADIQPVRLAEGNTHAFVTITRGCNNKCTFCVVPYTRGVERSRPTDSIVREVTQLREEGYKEVVLLGQNVNSYYFNKNTDISEYEDRERGPSLLQVMPGSQISSGQDKAVDKAVREMNLARGFSQKWIPKPTSLESLHLGVSFCDLLKRVSEIDPEMRIRFQSPHPKDFPDEVLHLIAETPNICNSLHMPAQSGSTTVLERMHRGYSREAYLSLIANARSILGKDSPEHVALGISSDFISGFCGETEQEHHDTLTLLQEVQFDQAFTYSYSMREQTYAGLFLDDNVTDDVKSRRLTELIDTFQSTAQARNARLEIGRLHVVLVEGEARSKRTETGRKWTGRTDSNKRVVFSDAAVLLDSLTQKEADIFKALSVVKDHDDITAISIDNTVKQIIASKGVRESRSGLMKGDYVIVKISSNRGHTLRGVPIATITNMRAQQLIL